MPDINIGKFHISNPQFEQKTQLLEKHLRDRTLQPISEFKKVGVKEAGHSSGFQAEHEYSDNEGDKAAFMVKSVLNHTLTKLHLRSKFLDKFTTLMNLQEKGKNYQDAKGFEKILAVQILLGEADTIQPEDFGVIEKEYENAKGEKVTEKLQAKIDHARSFYLSFSGTKSYLQNFYTSLIMLRSYGIKIDLEKLSKVLEDFIDYYDQKKEKFEALIDRKASSLNHVLNPNMQFNLRYIDGSRFNVPG